MASILSWPQCAKAEWCLYPLANFIIVLSSGLSPAQRQAVIWTNADPLSTGSLQIHSTEIWAKINKFPSRNFFENIVYYIVDHFVEAWVFHIAYYACTPLPIPADSPRPQEVVAS